MSFETHEESRSRGAPNTLYRFTYQSDVFAYTDCEESITHAGIEYQPIPVNRNSISTSGTLDRTTLTINLPHNLAIAELFRIQPPSDVVGVTVMQGHHDDEDAEYLAVWTGRVISCARAGSEASLVCEPVNTSMKRPGLRRRYQYGCPHALYGPQCKAVRANFTRVTTVVSLTQSTVTLPSTWNGAFAKGNFVGGLLEWSSDGQTELRTILRVDSTNNRITISGRTTGLVSGAEVSLSLGCNHQMSGCTVFNNIQNFGGQPWIPKKNPIGFVNNYY